MGENRKGLEFLMDDFERDVYCICGLPFDAVDMSKTRSLLRDAKFKQISCFLSTPNLNFLAFAQDDDDFRNSVIHSDIVIADGMPIVWMAKMLGIPVPERVAGSSMFEAFRTEWRRKMTVYFFGGPDGVAEQASKLINASGGGLNCVGYFSPGFGSLEDMSSQEIIDNINASGADFLVVALGAKKGQAWIVKNQSRIKLPLVSHLGAVINFQANRLKRAPEWFQKMGMEWAWRIKEEPHLWKRYWNDGKFFLRFLVSKIAPHALWLAMNRKKLKEKSAISESLQLEKCESGYKLIAKGVFMDPISSDIRATFRQASKEGVDIILDLYEAEYLSPGFFGMVMMLKKNLEENNRTLKLEKINPDLKKVFHWNSMSYLIESN